MYAIKNKDLDVVLNLGTGVVCCNTLEEARDLLSACHNYVDSIGLETHNFVIIDLNTEEEID
jgi:hypothetical protein